MANLVLRYHHHLNISSHPTILLLPQPTIHLPTAQSGDLGPDVAEFAIKHGLSSVLMFTGGNPLAGGIGRSAASAEIQAAGTAEGIAAREGGTLAEQGYQIIEGVRRAKAAEMLSVPDMEAHLKVGEKIVGTLRVNPSTLMSPKRVIDVSSPVGMQRWLRVLQGTRAGETLPPIVVMPGNTGTPIPIVDFQF